MKMTFRKLDIESVKKVTEKAVLVCVDDEEIWIPLSTLSTQSCRSIENGESPEQLDVHDWFMEKINR